MAEAIILLVLFNLVFFRRFYFQDPWVFCTSELASTAFPSSQLLGRAIRENKIPDDPYYYPYYKSIPFLSTFYPPHLLQAYAGAFCRLDIAWLIFCTNLTLHFLWASIGAYLLFSVFDPYVALFGAVSLAYMGYCIKQNPGIIYTVAWVPWLLCGAEAHDVWLFGTSLGAIILAGYWPIGIYAGALGCLYWLLH